MRNFLSNVICMLVISVVLLSLAPRAAADGVVILPNGTLAGLISFASGTSSDITVTVPLAQNSDVLQYVTDGTHLPQVVVETFWPGTNSPEDVITMQHASSTL